MRLSRLSIEALEDRVVPASFHPQYIIDNHGLLTTNIRTLKDITGEIPGYEPAQLRAAYGINAIDFSGVQGTGAGQTIAIIDAFNDPNIVSDLDMFDQQFGASSDDPSQTLYQQFGQASTFLKVFDEQGKLMDPAHTTVPVDPTGGGEFEESLDVEWAHAIAPAATIDLVLGNDLTEKDLYAAVKSAARLPGVSIVSMSFGIPEAYETNETANDIIFTTPAGHQGVTFLAAAGDEGTGSYPAFSPNVIAVGGTTLTLNPDNTIKSETGWSTLSDTQLDPGLATGGGISAMEAEPAFQLGVQQTGFRSSPDISFVADPLTGVAVFDTYLTTSPWNEVGGTSVSTPSDAGIMAIANQGRILQSLTTFNAANPQQAVTALYKTPAGDFNDITTGTIYNAVGYFGFSFITGPSYTAGPGYDMVSGQGTPIANRLVNDLASFTGASVPLPAPSTTLTTAPADTSEFGQSVTFTATVSSDSSSSSAPTGTVSFYAVPAYGSDILLGTVNLPGDGSGEVTFSTATLPVGNYQVTAFYGGDSTFAPGNAQAAFTVAQATTTTTLSTSAKSIVVGQPVTLTATLKSTGAGTPTGYVSFYDGQTLLRVVPLPKDGSGKVSFTSSSLPAGTHDLSAVYSGDVNFNASTADLKEMIARGTTTVKLHAAIVATGQGQRVSFTARVGVDLPSSFPLTGTLSFYDGTTLLKKISLPADGSDQVSITTSAARGRHRIRVVYSGDHNYQGSSATVAE
jgi:subtilase family serine protease